MGFVLPSLEPNIIIYLGLIIILGTVLGYIARALRQPTLVAYFLAGLIIGPFGLGIISNTSGITQISELGIAFLLFIAGLELQLGKLKDMGGPILVVSIIQLALTFIVTFFAVGVFGFGQIEAVYLGLVTAFSSTLIVVKYLSDKKKTSSVVGRWAIGILLLQDIFAILFISFIPHLGSFKILEIARIVFSGILLVSVAVIMNKFIIPSIIKYSARTKELFFLTALSTAFLFIILSYLLGFSIAIGGFLAGVALATYPYNIGIESEIKPLRDFFLVIFFTTIGMQIDPRVILPNIGLFLALLAIVVLVKPLTIIGPMKAFGYKKSVPILVGLSLAQASEFSFVMVQEGINLGQISPQLAAIITIFTLFTMILSPYLFRFSTRIAGSLSRSRDEIGFMELKDHIVILGCHKAGKYVIENIGCPLVCVDHDPEIIRNIRSNNHSCVYGEADSDDILEAVNVRKARIVISAVPELETNIFVVKNVKKLNRKVKVIARAISPAEALQLYKAGADYVVVPVQLTGEKMLKTARMIMDSGSKGDFDEMKKKEIKRLENEVKKGFLV